MEELIIDEFGNVVGKSFGVMSLDDFLECIQDINCDNNIVYIDYDSYYGANNVLYDVKNDSYVIKFYNKHFSLRTTDSKIKKKLNKVCKELKKVKNAKDTLGISTVNKERRLALVSALTKSNNSSLSYNSNHILDSSLHILSRIVKSLICLVGTPLSIYGCCVATNGVAALLMGLGFLASLIVDAFAFLYFFVGENSIYDYLQPFDDLRYYLEERKPIIKERKSIKFLNKILANNKQIESTKEESLPSGNNNTNILSTSERKEKLIKERNALNRYLSEKKKETSNNHYPSKLSPDEIMKREELTKIISDLGLDSIEEGLKRKLVP